MLEGNRIIAFDDYVLLDRSKKQLIIGQRIDDNYLYEFCEIPAGMPLPNHKDYANSGYFYYRQNINEFIRNKISGDNGNAQR